MAGRLARSLRDEATGDTADAAEQPEYLSGGYTTATTGYTTDTYATPATETYDPPTATPTYGTTSYGSGQTPGTTTGGYGGTA